jgi:Putative GTPase activating protein for Arf
MPPSVMANREQSSNNLNSNQQHNDDSETDNINDGKSNITTLNDNLDKSEIPLINLVSNEIEQMRIQRKQQQQQYGAMNGDCTIRVSYHAFPTACLSILKSIEGNSKCIDCLERNPQWAAVRYGALVCLKCSGHHRSLGVSVSTIRSVTMDEWTLEEVLSMLEGGNAQLTTFFARHALTQDAVLSSSLTSTNTTTSQSSATTQSSSSSSSSSSIRPQQRTTTTAAITKDNVVRMRYKTKAALFYRKQLELHIANVLGSGPYRGREISRRLKHHPLDKRSSTLESSQ